MAHKNAKFDSYLKRSLDKKVYEQVRVSDPCIVHGKNEKHTFRFVFITDEAICITANPPKSILFSVPFSDLRDVLLIHDTPKFLQKELQAIVQHISVQYVLKDAKEQSSPSQRRQSSISSNSVLKNVLNSLVHPKRGSVAGDNASPGSSRRTSVNSTKASSRANSMIPPLDGSPEQIQPSFNKNNHNNSRKDSSNRSYLSYFFSKRWQSPKSSANSLSDSGTGSGSTLSDNKSLASRDSLKWVNADPQKLEVFEQTPFDVEVVHLYILNDASVFYMMLKVVWRAYLLKSTALKGMERGSSSAGISSNRDLTNILLEDLKNDIIDGFREPLPMEYIYKYFHELKTVGEEYFTAKGYFWKDSTLLNICTDYLSKYSYPGSASHSNRADEIEFMILVCEALSEMLRQTEALSSCIKVLQKSCTSSFYGRLIKLLISKPTLPTTLEKDDELKSLIQDYAVAACDVIYELMTVAEQVSWNAVEILEPIFTSSVLFSLLEVQSDLVLFLQNVFSKCVSIWTSVPKKPDSSIPSTSYASNTALDNPANESLQPAEIVRVYRSFSVLHRCLNKCKQVKLSKASFKEEFTYYIRPDNLALRIPSTYPASAITRNIISAVGSCVLEGGDLSSLKRSSGEMNPNIV